MSFFNTKTNRNDISQGVDISCLTFNEFSIILEDTSFNHHDCCLAVTIENTHMYGRVFISFIDSGE